MQIFVFLRQKNGKGVEMDNSIQKTRDACDTSRKLIQFLVEKGDLGIDASLIDVLEVLVQHTSDFDRMLADKEYLKLH